MRPALWGGLFPRAALSVETSRLKLSLTSNCAPANGPVCRTFEWSSALGEQGERPNGPSVENMSQSVKSPLPPAVVTIMEPHQHKWLFSGFYSLAIHSISIVGVLGLPNASKAPFCWSFAGHYTFCPILYDFQKQFPLKDIMWPWCEKGPHLAAPLAHLFFPIISHK